MAKMVVKIEALGMQLPFYSFPRDKRLAKKNYKFSQEEI
jgi:hypothetical protein